MQTTIRNRDRVRPDQVERRLKSEYALITGDPLENFEIHPKHDNIFEWEGTVRNLHDTPYEGGTFKFLVNYPDTYPIDPPRLAFVTKIYHPNIDLDSGFVGLADVHKHQWSPVTTTPKILLSLEVLLRNPDVERLVAYEVAVEYEMEPEVFVKTARHWTKKYAV